MRRPRRRGSLRRASTRAKGRVEPSLSAVRRLRLLRAAALTVAKPSRPERGHGELLHRLAERDLLQALSACAAHEEDTPLYLSAEPGRETAGAATWCVSHTKRILAYVGMRWGAPVLEYEGSVLTAGLSAPSSLSAFLAHGPIHLCV